MLKLRKTVSETVRETAREKALGTFLLALLCLILNATNASAHDSNETKKQAVVVAVASNFYLPLQQILSSHAHNFDVTVISGSSGMLYSQLKNGAPFDLYLSADAERPQLLFAAGMSSEPVSYAVGQLALYPYNDKLPLKQQLKSANKISIANPKLAPFGLAAMQVLQSMSLEQSPNLVMGNSVAQAFQFVDSGNANIGLLSVSQLLQAHASFNDEKYLNYTLIDASLYAPIEQQAVIVKGAKNQVTARDFLTFLMSDEVQNHIVSLGYSRPSD
uniref:molybdate ABC transporter substrate-binding protein n=1 Tax=Ningiella ruwaisensis TaxID=2364274 RepID=UPI001446DAB8|nr:molybdate ABC transporter substrate-binding protein [Ningiella ruwaisensis]